ncbi:hypothetical protein [uncultured Roseobacter sp.]|uniref:hypothetical protein n=1 Tax=uncultured Roseobacter sp. TaxID=114847 RepID=UPI0026383482|nr:hypothetical protein [uncultured Roseobacter sp.]
MNRIINLEQMTVSLQDVTVVANVAVRQLSAVTDKVQHLVSDLLLNEPFALGYTIGFTEEACRRFNKGDDDDVCPDYMGHVIGQMLGNTKVAASFVLFAASKRGERYFEGGYDAGTLDFDAWFNSQGEIMPRGLVSHLIQTRGAG